jgi:hypothetical protein
MSEFNIAILPSRVKSLTGTYARLTVIGFHEVADGRAFFACRCECGKVVSVVGARVRSGCVKSCGCLKPGRVASGNAKSSMPEYAAWKNIQARCNRPGHSKYVNYGGRGIKVEFESFEAFLAEVGTRPGYEFSIDRKDNDGNYVAGNVRWATAREQSRNKRPNRILEFKGKSLCMADWTEELGFPPNLISDRLNRHGWSLERALTTPPRPRKSVDSVAEIY